MRCILALGALLSAVTLTITAPPASAHVCTNSVDKVRVGKQFALQIGVAAEGSPVTKVDIAVPKGFDLRDQAGFLGWVGTVDGRVIHFTTGTIGPFQCGYFSVTGVAPSKGAYYFDITTYAENGTMRKYADRNPYSPFPAMGLYVGMTMPQPDDFLSTAGNGGRIWKALGIAVLAGAAAVTVIYRINRNRAA